ncbi:enoyl-CoA hydratase/isomerase family protein [Paralimibaculum aggregatum]|uniref:Enoyl-CoA hydratase/isomerase family protein n=1 Tax=Paralimibaculum aggregatum TaxID=3036245 RepID=A0ABQ6LTJ2_9RHOB|nr:enoyl-CoA hydratase/isomerase family protein [Limibaculum sp. NKW23]GMG85397.1 enoyl-CoA hydratase/isomerase family protein [Limibaculum sp. NKW23]
MFSHEVDGGVAVLRLENPPVNAVSFAQWRGFPARLREIAAMPEVGAIVFTGLPGRHFCAGNDRREFASLRPEETDRGTAAVRDAMRAVIECPRPTIAAMHGAALGSGFMLCCASDIRIGAAGGQLGLPEVKAGAFGGYALARRVAPIGEARYMTCLGDAISAERAYQIGILQELCETPEAALARAVAIGGQIGGLLTGGLAATPAALEEAEGQPLWEAYECERRLAIASMGVNRPG